MFFVLVGLLFITVSVAIAPNPGHIEKHNFTVTITTPEGIIKKTTEFGNPIRIRFNLSEGLNDKP
jgi:hypothetical protein